GCIPTKDSYPQFFQATNKRGRRNMSSKKNDPIMAEYLKEEIGNLVEQDTKSPGAWNIFILSTVKKLQYDYDETMKYLSQITKAQFEFVCEVIDEVVYHFQREEMVDLIKELYHKFFGESTDTAFYRDNIEGLRNCIKTE
ncbi:MAG: hypothetical protein IKC73_05585, partial [Clostridia bacterium]|nr:hypothetical protein [Clostridia bacterium]